MKKTNSITISTILLLIYIFTVLLFYYAAGEQLYLRDTKNPITSKIGDIATNEITGEFFVTNTFKSNIDRIKDFSIQFVTFSRNNTGLLTVRLNDISAKQLLYEEDIDISKIKDGEFINFEVNSSNSIKGHQLNIEIMSATSKIGNAVAPLYNSAESTEDMQLYFNNKEVNGTLCFNLTGYDLVWTGQHYWKLAIIVGVLISFFCLITIWKDKRGKKSFILDFIALTKKYKFLVNQLVARDFKIKYKKSALGALWSLINPLLTMSVQYYVFSTLFQSDIKYYPVYLLSGIVLFGFFQESSGASIGAIVYNSTLINKVYVPKYIYPVSKVLSSVINLLISLIPLLIMIFITGINITKSWLIIPFILLCLFIFCIGISFILSTAMVFFRDIQFIWSVITMILMYATPVFYPESILPKNMQWILKVNPMYNYIQFFRSLIIEGVSPEPIMYVKCISISLSVLFLGYFIFKRSQDKFVYYL